MNINYVSAEQMAIETFQKEQQQRAAVLDGFKFNEQGVTVDDNAFTKTYETLCKKGYGKDMPQPSDFFMACLARGQQP